MAADGDQRRGWGLAVELPGRRSLLISPKERLDLGSKGSILPSSMVVSTLNRPMLTYHVPPQILFQKLDRDAVLLNLPSERYFGLDPVGARLWQVLAETHCLETAIQTLLREYAVDEAQLRLDVQELVESLIAKGLLVARAESSDAVAK
jgi:hypothetical protein